MPMMRLDLIRAMEASGKRPPGYAAEVIAAGEVVGDKLRISRENYVALLAKYSPDLLQLAKAQNDPDGPGTILHAMLRRIGIRESPGCDCLRMIHQMNLWGAAESLARIERIAQTMLAEADRRGWPHLPGRGIAVRAMIRAACRRSSGRAGVC